MSTAWSQPVPPVAPAPDGQIPAQPSPAPQSPYPYPYPYMVQAGPSQTAENTATWLMILTAVPAWRTPPAHPACSRSV